MPCAYHFTRLYFEFTGFSSYVCSVCEGERERERMSCSLFFSLFLRKHTHTHKCVLYRSGDAYIKHNKHVLAAHFCLCYGKWTDFPFHSRFEYQTHSLSNSSDPFSTIAWTFLWTFFFSLWLRINSVRFLLFFNLLPFLHSFQWTIFGWIAGISSWKWQEKRRNTCVRFWCWILHEAIMSWFQINRSSYLSFEYFLWYKKLKAYRLYFASIIG